MDDYLPFIAWFPDMAVESHQEPKQTAVFAVSGSWADPVSSASTVIGGWITALVVSARECTRGDSTATFPGLGSANRKLTQGWRVRTAICGLITRRSKVEPSRGKMCEGAWPGNAHRS